MAVVTVGLHLFAIRGYGWFRDEFYYLACAAHLDWGYVDHPPMVAVLTRLTQLLLGDSIVALRLPPILAHAVAVFVTGMLARGFGARRYGQALAAMCVMFAPVLLALTGYVSMNAYDIVCWTLLAWLLQRMVATGDPRWWALFGVVAGLGLENKHSVLFLGFGLVVGLVIAGPRRFLMSRWVVLGGAIAAAIVAPNVIWEIRHGWPTLEFMANATATKNVAMAPGTFLLEQVKQVSPFAAPIWIAGLAWLLLAREARQWRVFGLGYLAILGVFLLTAAKPYYLAPYYPILFAAGGRVADNLVEWPVWQAPLRALLVGLVAIGGNIALPLALPVLSEEALIAYMDRIHSKPAAEERHAQSVLPQFFADMHGWRELVDAVAVAAGTLTPEERRQSIVFTGNYGQAGAIWWLGRGRALPPVASGHNNYWLWGPGTDHVAAIIVVGGTAAEHEKACGRVTEVARMHAAYAMPYEADKSIFVCRDLKESVATLWPTLKHYQ